MKTTVAVKRGCKSAAPGATNESAEQQDLLSFTITSVPKLLSIFSNSLEKNNYLTRATWPVLPFKQYSYPYPRGLLPMYKSCIGTWLDWMWGRSSGKFLKVPTTHRRHQAVAVPTRISDKCITLMSVMREGMKRSSDNTFKTPDLRKEAYWRAWMEITGLHCPTEIMLKANELLAKLHKDGGCWKWSCLR